MLVIQSWNHMREVIGSLGEDDLRNAINYEVAVHGRKAIIARLYSRYNQLRNKRELAQLCNKELML